MKRLLSLLLLGLCLQCALAQTLTIKNLKTGQVIVGATLNDENENFTVTNANGLALIDAFTGSEQIQIRSLGYETEVKSYLQLKKLGFVLKLNPASLSLDEVVISGTRWRQSSANIPSKIISISAEDVELLNPQTAADLLNVSGKVFVQKSQQGGGSPMIRGFSTNRLLYTVDGVRMNNAIFRGGNIQNVINLDPFAIEKTEVLFGPGSVIYGSDAIGGVMSFKTLSPQFSVTDSLLISGKTVARYSSANGEKTSHFHINLGSKKLAFVSSFSNWNYGHLRQGRNGPIDYLKPYHVRRIDSFDRVVQQEDHLLQIPTGYTQFNTMQKLRFRPNEKLDLQYGYHFSQTSDYGRYDRHNRERNNLPRYATWNYGPQKWSMHNLSLNYLAKNKLFDEVALRLAMQSFEESRIERALNSDTRSTQIEKVNALSANLDFEKHTSAANTFYYGFEIVNNNVSSLGSNYNIITDESIKGPARYPQSVWRSIAFYLNDEFRLSEKLTLQAGVRYNQLVLNADFDTSFYPLPFTRAEINDGATTGNFGVVYRPSDRMVLKTSFGTAFRSPNVDDIGKVFDSEPGAVTVPNPNLNAEYAYNFDLSIAKIFSERLKVDITGYYTLLQNAIVRRNFQLNGADSIMYLGELSQVQALQNAAMANVYGLQAGFELKLPAGFNLSTDLNYQLGQEELEDGTISPSRHAAPFFGVSRLTYQERKLQFQIYMLYQGERSFENLAIGERRKDEIYAKDENGNNYSPAWYTVNCKVQYELSDVFGVNFGVENIFDARYRPYSSGLSGAGRNIVTSVRANF